LVTRTMEVKTRRKSTLATILPLALRITTPSDAKMVTNGPLNSHNQAPIPPVHRELAALRHSW